MTTKIEAGRLYELLGVEYASWRPFPDRSTLVLVPRATRRDPAYEIAENGHSLVKLLWTGVGLEGVREVPTDLTLADVRDLDRAAPDLTDWVIKVFNVHRYMATLLIDVMSNNRTAIRDLLDRMDEIDQIEST